MIGRKNMTRSKGFSLIELLIVIVLITIIAMIASYSWRRYVSNSHLRTGARTVAADFERYQGRAVSEGRTYTITVNQADNNYDIAALAKGVDLVAFNMPDVTPTEPSIAHDAQITAVDFTGCDILRVTPRGLIEHCAVTPAPQNDTGTVILTNSHGARATITINLRGKVDVMFADL